MTIVEKAAYLKGLTAGLGIEPDSRDGKLWGALTDLLSDMAHEIEDLQSSQLDYADTLDEVCDDLAYLEEVADALHVPDRSWDDEDDEDYFDEDDEPDNIYDLNFSDEEELEEDEEPEEDEGEDEDEDEEAEIDGILYDATCPSCGEEITFDEETLEKGSIRCPNCGEELEFDLGEDE